MGEQVNMKERTVPRWMTIKLDEIKKQWRRDEISYGEAFARLAEFIGADAANTYLAE